MTAIRATRPFTDAQLEPYFAHSRDAKRWLERMKGSLCEVEEFARHHTWEDLAVAGRRQRPPKLSSRLQYFKDETFLTAYGFAALDLLGPAQARSQRLDGLMQRALKQPWEGFRNPRLQLEQQVRAPKAYQNWLRGRIDESHPVAYVRALARGKKVLEGPTHVDALIEDGPRRVLFEAKFVSDISSHTTYGMARNQIARNLDAGLDLVEGRAENLFFILVTPRRFQEGPPARFYRYKMDEYCSDFSTLERDLGHRSDRVDYALLASHLGWVSWEDISELIRDSCEGAAVRSVLDFFAERRLGPSAV